ncbi:MAG: mechanosensitive ion channel family protein [Anaerolineae bacterium]|nr:mechanosensitive ion channel family protein [Anaerolineae bacterium]
MEIPIDHPLAGPLILTLVRIIGAVIIIVIGRWLARRLRGLTEQALNRAKLSETIVTLSKNIVYYTTLILMLMAILAVLGVPISIIITVAGLIVIVIAIALQQSLGNLAATINFSLYRPFEEGHLVETNGILGIVKEIQLLTTVIIGPDNKVHVLTNGAIQNAGLANYSKLGWVRREVSFMISYSDQIGMALQVIRDVLSADERVQQDPPPHVFVENLGDHGVEIGVWPFIEPANYWAIQFDLVEQVKAAFDQAGITVPFPQRDLHVRSGVLSVKSEMAS